MPAAGDAEPVWGGAAAVRPTARWPQQPRWRGGRGRPCRWRHAGHHRRCGAVGGRAPGGGRGGSGACGVGGGVGGGRQACLGRGGGRAANGTSAAATDGGRAGGAAMPAAARWPPLPTRGQRGTGGRRGRWSGRRRRRGLGALPISCLPRPAPVSPGSPVPPSPPASPHRLSAAATAASRSPRRSPRRPPSASLPQHNPGVWKVSRLPMGAAVAPPGGGASFSPPTAGGLPGRDPVKLPPAVTSSAGEAAAEEVSAASAVALVAAAAAAAAATVVFAAEDAPAVAFAAASAPSGAAAGWGAGCFPHPAVLDSWAVDAGIAAAVYGWVCGAEHVESKSTEDGCSPTFTRQQWWCL